MKILIFTITVFPTYFKILYFCSQLQYISNKPRKKKNIQINLTYHATKHMSPHFHSYLKPPRRKQKKYVKSLFPQKKAHKLFLFFFLKMFVKTHLI